MQSTWKLLTSLMLAFTLSAAPAYGFVSALAKSAPQEGHPNDPIHNPDISIFVNAIVTAGLTDLFDGTGPFTAFAPSNQAFEKLGKKEMERLLKPENTDELVTLLMYHILPGKYPARNLKTRNYRTLSGKNIDVDVVEGVITVNNAKVIKTDMFGPYGVIHEIDTVLVKPAG